MLMVHLGNTDETTRAILQAYRFDEERFLLQQRRLREGRIDLSGNILKNSIQPPKPGDIHDLRNGGTPEARRRGEEAIARGEVGVVILAGGMATRFGGVVKAAVEVVDGFSFLELKLRDLRLHAKRAQVRLSVLLMTSFATHADISVLAANATDEWLHVRPFAQEVSLRMQPDGELFREDDGSLSPYAPGHGDLSFALRRSGELRRFRESGGRTLVVSNVDNLAATLDPAIVGTHLLSGVAITAEVVDREDGDRGGAPARIGDNLQIVEGFRFPPGWDLSTIPVFNTNTLLLDAEAIDREFDLTFFYVEKEVGDRKAVQLERLVGELTAKLPSRFVHVERHGARSRFQPAKDPEELEARLGEIVMMLKERGILS